MRHFELKIRILETYGSQVEASKELEIREPRLSQIIRGHVDPTSDKRAKLIARFGTGALRPTQKCKAAEANQAQ